MMKSTSEEATDAVKSLPVFPRERPSLRIRLTMTRQLLDRLLWTTQPPQSSRGDAHGRSIFWSLTAAGVIAIAGGGAAVAQDACCFEPAYRLECETEMVPQQVTKYRISYETKYVEEEQVTYRPVLKTRVEQREYRVARPVTETSYREEHYTVRKPVTETSYRNEEVTKTRYVTETAEREEKVTTYKPVVETSYREERRTVQRPVVETQMRQQQYQVQRPVVETQYQTQQYTTYRPVTTYKPQTVDAGGYVAQQVVTPGQVQYGLQWVPRAYAQPGPLGIFSINRGAAVMVPQVTPPTVQTQLAYRPNYVTQQVAQTSYVPQVQQVQRPVQVQRMETETVTQNVPVQVRRMETEVITEKVPVQKTRMVPVTTVRKVPYTVQRPVTETSTRRVPVTKTRWVTEERVRKVPVKTTRMVYETKTKPVEVQYYEQEEVRQVVKRPVTRRVCVPYTETVMVPRQVVQRMPLQYSDPFSPAIISGYSSFDSEVVGDAEIVEEVDVIDDADADVIEPPELGGESDIDSTYSDGSVQERAGVSREKPAVPESSSDEADGSAADESVLMSPENGEETPQTRLQGVETGPIEPPRPTPDPNSDTELNTPQSGGDTQDGGAQNGSADDAQESNVKEVDVREAGYQIEWNPVYAREA